MAYVSIGAKFKPFSFNDLIAPVSIAQQEHQQAEQEYSALQAQAGVWDTLANEQTDPLTYQRYQDYSNDLQRVSGQLAQSGLNPNSKRELLNLKSRYNTEIAPIQLAYDKRNADVQAQRDALSKDNTVIFDRDASMTSLDDYLTNQTLTYTPVSGGLVTKRVADAVSNYKNQLRSSSNWYGTASGQLLERIERYGLTPEDISTIQTNPEAFPEITQLIDNVVQSTGVQNWSDQSAVGEVMNYAYEGLFAGLGKDNIDTRNDQSYLNPYQQWKWAKERAAMEETQQSIPNQLWDWRNQGIEQDNSDTRALNNQVSILEQLAQLTPEELANIPQTIKQTVPSAGNNPRSYSTNMANPVYTQYQALQQKYGTTDVKELQQHLNNEIQRRASLSRDAVFNNIKSDILSRYVQDQLFNTVDLDDKRALRKVIKPRNSDDKLKRDDIDKLFNGNLTLAVNPATGKVILSNYDTKYGQYEVEPEVFANLMVSLGDSNGLISGNDYLRNLSNAYTTSFDLNNASHLANVDALISNFYNALNTRIRSGVPEVPSSSSKSSLYNPEE